MLKVFYFSNYTVDVRFDGEVDCAFFSRERPFIVPTHEATAFLYGLNSAIFFSIGPGSYGIDNHNGNRNNQVQVSCLHGQLASRQWRESTKCFGSGSPASTSKSAPDARNTADIEMHPPHPPVTSPPRSGPPVPPGACRTNLLPLQLP